MVCADVTRRGGHNHTDGCGWGYEKDDWEGSEHQRWLDKIEKLVDHKFQPINVNALSTGHASLYGRRDVNASNTSANATIRADKGISSPLR